MQIAATMPLRRDAGGWIVPSQSGPGTYRVSPHPTTTYKVAQGIVPPPDGIQPYGCSCPDFELRGKPCKHVIAVQYVVRRETVNPDGAIVTEEMKVTYTQPWAAYNAGQCAEGDLFPKMLADLCSTIENAPQGRGRPRLPMSDMAFTAIAKVYSGLSARRFDSDVREAKARGLTDVDPSFATVLRYLRDPALTPELERLVTLSALPLSGVEDSFAIDSTGFTTCTYTRWYDHKWGKEQKRQDWVKLHAVCGVVTNIVTAATVTGTRGAGTADSVNFGPLLAKTAKHFNIAQMSADKAYSSKANLQAVEDHGGVPLIPFRESRVRGPQSPLFDLTALPPSPDADVWVRMYHFFAYQRDTFLANYHRRSNVESTFSVIKRKFGGSLRSKSEVGQFNETLAKVVAHNLCVIISCVHEIGLEAPTFNTQLAG
jgi:hypothetical protein